MALPGIIGPALTRLLEGKRAQVYLFAGLIAVALVDAWPERSVERTAIHVGRRLCETSAVGTADTLAGTRYFPNVVVIGSYIARRLHDNRVYFEQDCQVVLRVGDVPPRSWGDGRAHYFLVLTSQGEGRIAIRLRWEHDWSVSLRSCCGYRAGRFHVKIAPVPDL